VAQRSRTVTVVAHPLLTTANATVLWLMEPDAGDWPTTLAERLARPAWHARAACRGQGTAEWIKATSTGDYTGAKAVCSSCPVRAECLDYALADPSLVGCWGGTTERERRDLRRSVA
jgi:WhiB family redox-sensing transcriptional regulator